MTEDALQNCVTLDKKKDAFFSKLSSEWWDLNSDVKNLHNINNLTYEFILKTFPDDDERNSKTVIDVGCGGGILSEKFAKAGFNVLGIDTNLDLIKAAQQHASLDKTMTNLSYCFECVEKHVLENREKYDVVILNYVLYHAINHEVLLSCCAKLLKPNGHIFLTCIGKTFKAWMTIILLENILRILPVNSHIWDSFITCEAVEDILQSNNCTIKTHRGLYYNVFKSAWNFCKDTDSFYIVHATKNG